MKECYFCNSTELESITKYVNDQEKKFTLCKTCGFGYGNTGNETKENFDEQLENQINAVKMMKVLFPEDTPKQLHDRYAFHQHRIEEHPIAKDGYCQFCEVNWNTMTDQEFKERLGYDKSKWFEDGKNVKY